MNSSSDHINSSVVVVVVVGGGGGGAVTGIGVATALNTGKTLAPVVVVL